MKMSETNEQLNRICIEHDVHVIADMHQEIVEFWDSIPNDARLAIRGAGKHTVELFNLVRYWEKNIIGIFDDSKFHEEDLPYPILDVAEMEKFDIDTIYFASYDHRFDMMDEFEDQFATKKGCQYLDVYRYLVKEKNRIIGKEFFREVYFNEMFYAGVNPKTRMTLELYYARKYFEEEKKSNARYAGYYLKVLISDYIKIRDFVNAYYYIDEYINNQYEEYARYQKLKNSLYDFLKGLKANIMSRKASDSTIFFFLFDGMSYEVFNEKDSYRMDFLHEYTDQKGVEFENAYSPGGFTGEIMTSIFFEKDKLEENFYDLDINDKMANKFNKHLENKGFRIKIYGFNFIENKSKRETRGISGLFWDVICDLSEHDEATFYYVHEVGLFHYPTQCNRQSFAPINWDINQKLNLNPGLIRENAVKDSVDYLDKNMKFYFEYFSEDSSKVIFADHGWINGKNETVYYDVKPWRSAGLKVPLLVFSKHFQPQKVKDLYSTFYLSDLLYDLLNGTDTFLERKIEFAQTNATLLYSSYVFWMLKKQFGKCAFNVYRAFTTLEDRYVITYAGQEYYYRLPDEDTNLINDPKYQGRIQYIKSKNDLSFPDFIHPKYKETRCFYFDELDRPTHFFDE